MGRPKPRVLVSHTDKDYMETRILECPATYRVEYRGQPFNIKRESMLTSQYKYLKTAFNNRGTAELMARKLNTQFKCNDFTVKELK